MSPLLTRRALPAWLLSIAAAPAATLNAARAETWRERHFVEAAARMRRQAIDAGDQPFGAVIVKDGEIVGWGPSRVVIDRNPNAHAERVALWDAQRRLGPAGVVGAAIYSTSRPCIVCETALAAAGIARMRHGPSAADAGRPRQR